MSRLAAEAIRKGRSAIIALERGAVPTDRLVLAAIAAMAATAELHGEGGRRDEQAEASAQRARLIRTLAGLSNRADPVAGLRAALRAANEARDLAVKAGEFGVNDVNLSAYVAATNEAAICNLDLGRGDPSDDGTAHLAEAADFFGEVAAGYRRLGRTEPAGIAQIKALEARAERALRDLNPAVLPG
jgi:hypothetical protein